MAKYDVFLSYNRADEGQVGTIAQRLRQEAKLNPFLDRWHLVPGEPWMEALEQALDDSGSCAVFLGKAKLGTWENEEMRVALDIRANNAAYRVIPVLLPGASLPERGRLPHFLARHTWVDFRPGLDDPDAFHRLVSGILGVAPVPENGTESEIICPFRGLEVFNEEHARFFYGREALTQHLVEQLREDRFLAVIGASGSGKSSLVRAGLVPQVRQGALPDSKDWPIVLMKPGADPVETLAARLVPHLSDKTAWYSTHQKLVTDIQKNERGLHRFIQVELGDKPDNLRLMLVVDQFEEVFTLCQNEREREQFIANLLYASAIAGGQTIVVITMRADFFGKCAAYPDLATRLAERDVLVGAMSAEELRLVMKGPAQSVGLDYEKGLVNAILNDLGDEPGTLPLLQHMLLELCERRQGHWLTHNAYEAIGGVQGALAMRAETVYKQLNSSRQAIARQVMLRLIQPGEGTGDTRRRVSIKELLPAEASGVREVKKTVAQLTDARLLTRTAEDGEADDVVDLAHEALILGWPRLRTWIDKDRAALRTHRRLTETAVEWRNSGRNEDFLLRGARLAEAEEWVQTHVAVLNELETAFLEASIYAREAQRIASQRRVQRFVAFLIIGVVAISVFAVVAFVQRNQATRQASRLLAGQSISQLDDDYDLALLLAIEAGKTADTFEAEAALHQSLVRQGPMKLLTGHAAAVKHAAWNPTGTQIATASEDGTARVWDAKTGTELQILSTHTDSVEHLAWNRAGTQLVTASRDGTGRIWDAASGAELATLKGHNGQVNFAAWNPADTQIVTTSADGTARVWDAQNGSILSVLAGHNDLVYQADWCQDGKQLVTVGDDGTARLWDAESGAELLSFTGHTDRVWQVVWNKEGSRIVTASADGTARVWDSQDGAQVAVLKGHNEAVYQASWNEMGTRIVTTGADGSVRLWDAESGTQLAILTDQTDKVLQVGWTAADGQITATGSHGNAWVWDSVSGELLASVSDHISEVLHAAWDNQGTQVVTAGSDGIARLRSVDHGREVADLQGHSSVVRHMAWNEPGSHLLTVSDDQSARVWDVEEGIENAIFTEHEASVRQGGWNGVGSRIVTVGDDHVARIWDAFSGTQFIGLSGHTDKINHAEWNRDGTQIVTASSDNTARIWHANSGAELALLIGHTDRVIHAAWNGDGAQIVTTSEDGTARVWDSETGSELVVFANHTDSVFHADWDERERRIVTASADGTARIWDARDGTQTAVLDDHHAGVLYASWNSTGDQIVTASQDGTARIWNAQQGTPIAILSGHSESVEYAAWNADDSRIVTASFDGTARVWDVQSGTEVAALYGDKGPILQAVWNKSGTRIATSSLDGTVRIYYTLLPDLLLAACQRTVRNMSDEEWKQYMGEEAFRVTCSKP